MSIMDMLFSKTASNQAPAPAPAPAPATTTNQQQGTDQQSPAGDKQTQNSPLDNFVELWQPKLGQDGKPIHSNVPDLSAPIFTPDPNKISESAKGLDFTRNLNPETVQKALNGDISAFADVINTAVRQAFVANAQLTGTLVNQAVVANNSRVQQVLPSQIKQVQLDHMPVSNPALEHPSVAPLVKSLRKMAFEKDPNADPALVNKKIEDYLTNLAAQMNSHSSSSNGSNANSSNNKDSQSNQDWDSWFNLPSQ